MSDDTKHPPAVIASVYEEDPAQARERMAAAPASCRWVELRADGYGREAVVELVRSAGRPVIVTQRPASLGGRHRGTDDERRETLRAALDAGAAYVDVEEEGGVRDLLDDPAVAGRTILSHHGADCRVEALWTLYGRMASRRPGRVKLVPRAERPDELIAIREVLARARDAESPLSAFALGAAGRLSRLLAPSWGSWGVYGAANPEAPAGEGQWSVSDLIDRFDVLGIGDTTRLFALIGERLSGSPSPALHRAAYRESGIDARYLPLEGASLDALRALIEPGPDRLFEGFGVTMPFKEAVAAECRLGDAIARSAGAVNTVVVRDGRWVGFNTDGPAARELLAERHRLAGSRVAIVGAGGTARGVAAALRDAGSSVTLFNRDAARGETAARAVGARREPIERLSGAEWDLLVQATPLGRDGERWIEPDALRGRGVLDAVYRPGGTVLVRDALALGLFAVDGYDLLVRQAVGQFERLTGARPDEASMRAALPQWVSGPTP